MQSRIGWLVLMGLVTAGVSSAEVMIAGWDKSLAIGGGVPQSADYVAVDITSTAFWGGQDPARSDRGSSDLTFGTFAGAAASTNTTTGAQVIYETTYIDFTVVNNGVPGSFVLAM